MVSPLSPEKAAHVPLLDLLRQKEYLGTKGSASLRGFLSFSGDGFLLAVTNERRQLFSFEFEEKQLSFLER
jgi:hypothetical protein